MITDLSGKTQGTLGTVTGHMRSPRGFLGALVLLLMLPLTVLYQMVFANGIDTFIHWVLATGALLIAVAVFDFRRLPTWMNWIGCLSAGALAAILFLQGLSHLLPNDALTTLAYGFLAQWPEPWFLRLFLYGWGGALLLLDSGGKTRIFGWVALATVLSMEVYSLSYVGAASVAWLRALYLLPFVWLLLESKKQIAAKAGLSSRRQ
jgi:hypothetical protein